MDTDLSATVERVFASLPPDPAMARVIEAFMAVFKAELDRRGADDPPVGFVAGGI